MISRKTIRKYCQAIDKQMKEFKATSPKWDGCHPKTIYNTPTENVFCTQGDLTYEPSQEDKEAWMKICKEDAGRAAMAARIWMSTFIPTTVGLKLKIREEAIRIYRTRKNLSPLEAVFYAIEMIAFASPMDDIDSFKVSAILTLMAEIANEIESNPSL